MAMKSSKPSSKLAALGKRAAAATAQIEKAIAARDRAETQRLKKLAATRDPKAQIALLDASMEEELRLLIDKFFLLPPSPFRNEWILFELLRLLSKIIAKLFILQGMQPPPMDPRLLGAMPSAATTR